MMDWSNERYVRVYTRDTTTWKLLDWRGRVVLSLLIRKVDRAGVLDVGHDGVLGLAAVLELPIDIVEPGIGQLVIARGGAQPTVVDTGTAYVLPNFLEAQEAPSSDPQRKRESRARHRDRALAMSRKLLPAGADDRSGHETGRYRDEIAEEVTPCLAVPSRSDPSRDQDLPPARAIPPSPAPAPRAPMPAVDPALAHRQSLRLAIWSELAAAREAVATELKLPAGDRKLMAFDPGERALGTRLADARNETELELIAQQARKAIAVIAAEARASRSVEWLTGSVFESDKSWRRAIGKSLEDAKRPPKSAIKLDRYGKPELPPQPRPEFPEPVPAVSAADREEARLAAAEFRERMFGRDAARAPPESVPVIDDEPDDIAVADGDEYP